MPFNMLLVLSLLRLLLSPHYSVLRSPSHCCFSLSRDSSNAFALMNVYFALLFTFIISCRLLVSCMSTNYEMYSFISGDALCFDPSKISCLSVFTEMFFNFSNTLSLSLSLPRSRRLTNASCHGAGEECCRAAITTTTTAAAAATVYGMLCEYIESTSMTIIHENVANLSFCSLSCLPLLSFFHFNIR